MPLLLKNITMDQENFSAQDSLKVIQSMIDRAKENVKKDSFYFLLWGWLVFFAAILHFCLLKFTDFKQPYLVWNLMWVGAIASIIKGVKLGREKKVRTYIDDTMKYFGMSLGLLYTGLAFVFGKYDLWIYSFPIYILLYAVGCFFMGSIMQFPLLRWTGLFCIALVVVSLYVNYQSQLLFMAFAVLISYIIPGHILNAKEKNQNS